MEDQKQQCFDWDKMPDDAPLSYREFEDLYRYHTFAARATLFPDKSMEEVNAIIENQIEDMRLNAVYDIDTRYRENQDKFLIKKQIQDMETNFETELQALINRYSLENHSDTPDFILAQYVIGCLDNFNSVIARREKWYGRNKLFCETIKDEQLDIPFPSEADELMNTMYDEECDREANLEELRAEGYLLREDDYPEPKTKKK